MKSKGFVIDGPPPGASQVAIGARPVSILHLLAGAGARAPADRTASLNSGGLEDHPASAPGPRADEQVAAPGQHTDEGMMGELGWADTHHGVVVALVLLAAAFVSGGIVGFLLALLLR